MKRTTLLLLIFLLIIFSSLCQSQSNEKIIKIGVLSHRGDTTTLKVWSPVAEYLSEQLAPLKFIIVPLDFHHIEPAVSESKIDFLLANPGIYVNMEVKYRISRLVTLNKIGAGHLLNQFGGVAFTLAHREDINTFEDLKGKTFVAVDKTSLGGYQMVWRELNDLNIDPARDFKKIAFAGTHDKVVMAVKNGEYDAGTVRTGILEKMVIEGRIKIEDFKLISAKHHNRFPLLHSTRLYPEWPFSKLHHTDNELAQKVAIILMNMPDKHKTNSAIDYSGWTVPLDYQEVHELFKQLSLPPYKKGNFTLVDAIKKYWQWLLMISIFLVMLITLSLWIVRLNHRLKQSKLYLERQHDLILDSVCDGIYGVDTQGNCTFVNKSMEKITGWTREDLIGNNQHQILHHTYADGTPHPQEACPVYQTITEKQPRYVNNDVFWKKDGNKIPVEYSSTPVKDNHGNVVGSVVVFRDISERITAEENKRKFQDDLMHMSRLNTMGEMASGIAHELNQPLTAIATSAFASIKMLESGSHSTNTIIDILEQIAIHAEKSGKIIKQLRNFVKKETPEKQKIDILILIKNILTLMKPELEKAKIKVEFDESKKMPLVWCQPIQIDQVVLNLCKNAVEAMQASRKPEKKLTVDVEVGGKNALIISITDNGDGIDEKMIQTLFDPFITTKENGMGLGLSICKGIIDAHQGNIYLAQNSRNGCCFRFTLPINTDNRTEK